MPTNGLERLRLVVRGEVRHAALRRVDERAAEGLRIDLLVGHGLHDVGTGHEHVARPLDHDREVGHRRRVHRAAGARTHDHRDLRHDARGHDVAQEDVGVAAERGDALLDPRAAGIVEADERCADLHREVHDLADLLGVRLGQRATEDREVLAEDEDEPPVHGPVAGDDAVAEEALIRDARILRAVGDEGIELHERPRIEEEVEALAGRQLAPRMLALDPHGPAAEERLGPHLSQAAQPFVVRGHGRDSSSWGRAGCEAMACVSCLCAETPWACVPPIVILAARRSLPRPESRPIREPDEVSGALAGRTAKSTYRCTSGRSCG